MAARITRTLFAFEYMARLKQYTIRNLFIATAIASVAIVLYMASGSITSRQTVAVGFFGPGPLEYTAAHETLIREIDRTKYSPMAEPAWAATRIDFVDSGFFSDRSDWFAVDKNGARNFVHIASSSEGFTVNVWIYKRILSHQTVYRENLLTNEVVSEISTWWHKWLSENDSNANNGK